MMDRSGNMKGKRRLFWLFPIALFASFISACVPKSELAEAKASIRECKERKDSLLEVNEKLKNENASLKKLNEKLRPPDSLKKELGILRATVDSLQARNRTLNDSLEALRDLMKSQRKNLGEVYEEHNQMKAIICDW